MVAGGAVACHHPDACVEIEILFWIVRGVLTLIGD